MNQRFEPYTIAFQVLECEWKSVPECVGPRKNNALSLRISCVQLNVGSSSLKKTEKVDSAHKRY